MTAKRLGIGKFCYPEIIAKIWSSSSNFCHCCLKHLIIDQAEKGKEVDKKMGITKKKIMESTFQEQNRNLKL